MLGIGALKTIADQKGEVKSMRTADESLRRGVGGAILAYIEAEACDRGYAKIFLETGVAETYAPANAFYRRNGYTQRGPFCDYVETGFNVFYEKAL